MSGLEQALRGTIRQARERFPDLDFLSPGGELRVDVAPTTVDRVRVDVGAHVALQLQSVGVTTTEGLSTEQLVARSTVTASSWHGDTRAAFEPVRLLDAEHPSGIAVHTQAEQQPWVELTFEPPVEITGVRLRGLPGRAVVLNRAIRVQIGSPGEPLVTVHEADQRAAQVGAFVDESVAAVPAEARDEYARLAGPLTQTLTGRYGEARAAVKELKRTLSDDGRRAYVAAVNDELLRERSLEWTAHGPLRSFRFWSESEKLDYIEFAVSVADALRDLTPNVCFGYGAALAVVRDGDLIPHDDDLDLIIAFEPDEAATLPEAHARVEEFLRARGFVVKGDFFGHRHVARPGGKHIDVFSGLFEGDRVSWYPGTRGALARSSMFPISRGELLGISCPLPADPVTYLETIYGPGWSTPDPAFKHTWRKRDFADQAAPPPVAVEVPDAPAPDAPRRGWLDRMRGR
ncbi:hypothetical protein H9L21_06085 [Aeromicrobium senzhongii]|uniref:LicD family protein n=1 Tax=Aeromicrobium senzhongii TaxID=2663859 RepID=A0ABX6SVR4_9ACTN|nr:hypothetical protein [Aeromicrobium senzhongii]MTB87465.1 hypothetical protein [Aeromicrobium senzhongii]QNL95483.1 hypothetical protein H9L21_06085 [Aeromicrobium senzhongii]